VSLDRKPHNLRAFTQDQLATAQREALPLSQNPIGLAFTGQLTPLTAEQVYKVYGVESKDSAELLCEVADAKRLAVGAHVWFAEGEAWYRIAASPRLWLADPETDHAQVLLTRAPLKGSNP
jgi:hypothetical protein